MGQSTLCKIWSVVALFALYAAVNGVADVQNSPFMLPLSMELDDERGKAAKAVFWFVCVSVPYLACLHLANAYALRQPAEGRALQSWPAMFSLELSMQDKLARRYQQFWMVLVLALPLYACGFLLNEVAELEIHFRGEQPIIASAWWGHLSTYRFSSQYVVAHEEDGIEVAYFTAFEFTFFCALLAAVLYKWFSLMVTLRKKKVTQGGQQ